MTRHQILALAGAATFAFTAPSACASGPSEWSQ